MSLCKRYPNQTANQFLYVPLCESVRDFVIQSCKIQTYYANLEGVHSRRYLNCLKIEKEKDYLKQFIECTVYPEESFHSDLDAEKKNHVNLLTEKVISVGLNFSKTEIHFSSVWLCYFDYAEKNLKNIPFIKVFTSTNLKNDTAVYIDVNASSFDQWGMVLDFVNIPSSFVCVPRHGKYTQINDKLDLEYFSTVGRGDLYSCGNSAPFSFTVIAPRLETIKNFCSTCLKVPLEWASFIVAAILGYYKEAKSNLLKAANQLKKTLIMLYDKNLRDIDFKGLFTKIYNPKNLDDTTKVIADLLLLLSFILPSGISSVGILVNLFTNRDPRTLGENLINLLTNLKLVHDKFRDFFDEKREKLNFSNLEKSPIGVCDKTTDIFSTLKEIDQLPLENQLKITEIKNEELRTLVRPESGLDPVFYFKKNSFEEVGDIIKNIVKVNFSLTFKHDNDNNKYCKWDVTNEKHQVIGYLLVFEKSIIGCFSKNLFQAANCAK